LVAIVRLWLSLEIRFQAWVPLAEAEEEAVMEVILVVEELLLHILLII